ncbi:hypothetical protein QJS66_03745 [Kocuria rhizophila]|nr:hypothetical protein QJS66_03745 [Kocuria rhizophila]
MRHARRPSTEGLPTRSTLFELITLRGLTAETGRGSRRLCQYSAFGEDGVPTDWHLVHYGSRRYRRRGGGRRRWRRAPSCPRAASATGPGPWERRAADGSVRIVDFAHQQGAAWRLACSSPTRDARPARRPPGSENPAVRSRAEDGGWQTVGPSAVAFPGLAEPVALDEQGTPRAAGVAASARRAVEAGMDFVELHGAPTVPPPRSPLPLSNERPDEYGGTLDRTAPCCCCASPTPSAT